LVSLLDRRLEETSAKVQCCTELVFI
jgi:hypothetical protein